MVMKPSPSDAPARKDGAGPTAATQTVRRTMVTLVCSLVVMLPWPVLGILLTQSQFDEPEEAAISFGGVTMLVLIIPAAIIGGDWGDAFIVLIALTWGLAWLVPPMVLRRRLRQRNTWLALLGSQCVFAFAQAALGAMMVIGKNV